MKIRFKIIALLFLVSIAHNGLATNNDELFAKEIDKLNTIGQQIINADNDEAKYAANTQFKNLLEEVINNPASFDFSFDQMKSISVLKANFLKIYNWVIPKTDGTFEYFAILQLKSKKDDTFKIVELIDQSETIQAPQRKTLTTKNWFGALYYELIHNKKIGQNYYTLLGWDGNNNFTNKKVIETIQISANGMIKFGVPILKGEKRTERRVIFEYSENAVMSLKYHPKQTKIVFDYLVPASSKLKGIYEYYGPSLDTFDAFIMDKGKWVYEKNTEIKLERNIKDDLWKKPEDKVKID